jgi:hypothetical protein
LINPKVYYVFYQFFNKTAVGESTGRNAWTAVKHASAMMQQRPSCFCSLQTITRLGSMKRS